MKQLVFCDTESCVGCNRCVRNCPVETANIVMLDSKGDIKVDIDAENCIACGECIKVCRHGARSYTDDTEVFLDDLRHGAQIAVMIAPAVRANRIELGRLIAWLRALGAAKIHDVSLGADLCIWAHVRYLQQHPNSPIITQPCPAIVNYILKYRPKLIRYLSPVQGPMASSAIYMTRYEKIGMPIAAISPCISKTHEFESTGHAKYNVTFEKLFNYIDEHGITLPTQPSGFDHYDCALGSVFSTPGGLKENIEFFLGNSLSIDRAEGKHVVYRKLDEYDEQHGVDLPNVFDVLNCEEGCNMGPASANQSSFFQVSRAMDKARKAAWEGRDASYFEALYEEYDTKLQLNHFLRSYTPMPAHSASVTDADIEKAYMMMNKDTDAKRKFDCGACGSDTCLGMARKLALHVNIPENCLQSSRLKIEAEQQVLSDLHRINLDNAEEIERDIDQIKGHVEQLWSNISAVNSAISGFDKVEDIINNISFQINIIAINASIEAARLGEVGKAFSVIAEEVRKLARVTQETMAENHAMIAGATGTMGGMNAMIKQILDSVTSAYDRITEINRANAENSSLQI
ncbi:MAG: methyl-accepting chemotaxis protein [Clostridiales bacterium]|nr:methyl-accepting chemotaxis protein [Clostridiales bacterium]